MFQHSSSFKTRPIHVINIHWILTAYLGKCCYWEHEIIFKLFSPQIWLFSHETPWNSFRQWIYWMKLWPLRTAISLKGINVWRSMKIIQTKHLKNSVARKQVCVPSKLQMRRNHFIGSHLEFSPPYSHPVIWLSPAPHLTLNWTETWPLWLCPPQGSHPLRPTLLSAPHGLLGLFHLPPQLPHLPVHTHLSFSGSAGWLHRQVPLASQTQCVYNPASEPFLPREALFPVMPSPGRQPCCHAWWFLLWDVPESSPLSFPLSCLVSAVRVVGNMWALETVRSSNPRWCCHFMIVCPFTSYFRSLNLSFLLRVTTIVLATQAYCED